MLQIMERLQLKKARTSDFDLILMDIHMPGISGIEATEQIRLFDTEIPILALTAVTIDENIDDFYEAGFNDIIPKPYKVEEFFQKIHNGLKTKTKQSVRPIYKIQYFFIKIISIFKERSRNR